VSFLQIGFFYKKPYYSGEIKPPNENAFLNRERALLKGVVAAPT
jgi:hypothetical protein